MLCIGEYLWNTKPVSQLFATNCWRFMSTCGTDTGEIEIEQHQFWVWVLFWLLVFIWLPSSPVWVDQEVWWVPAFSRIGPEKYVIIIQGPRHHRVEQRVPIYVILLQHCGSAKDLKSRKSLVFSHLPSIYRFTLSFYVHGNVDKLWIQ